MRYVDGFVLPVPKKKLQAYSRMARKAGEIWKEHGALEVRECAADHVKPGKLQIGQRNPHDVVVLEPWIDLPHHEHA